MEKIDKLVTELVEIFLKERFLSSYENMKNLDFKNNLYDLNYKIKSAMEIQYSNILTINNLTKIFPLRCEYGGVLNGGGLLQGERQIGHVEEFIYYIGNRSLPLFAVDIEQLHRVCENKKESALFPITLKSYITGPVPLLYYTVILY